MSKTGELFVPPSFPGGKQSKISPHFFKNHRLPTDKNPSLTNISQRHRFWPFFSRKKPDLAFSEQSPTWKGRPMTSNVCFRKEKFGWFSGVLTHRKQLEPTTFILFLDLCSPTRWPTWDFKIFRASKSTWFPWLFGGPKAHQLIKIEQIMVVDFNFNMTPCETLCLCQHWQKIGWNIFQNCFLRVKHHNTSFETTSDTNFVAKENMTPPLLKSTFTQQQHPRIETSPFLYAKLHLPKRPSRKLYLDLILADVEQGGPQMA